MSQQVTRHIWDKMDRNTIRLVRARHAIPETGNVGSKVAVRTARTLESPARPAQAPMGKDTVCRG